MEIYIGVTVPNQQVQFTVSIVPGIIDGYKLPRGSQENVENYINDEIVLLYLYNVKIMFKTRKYNALLIQNT